MTHERELLDAARSLSVGVLCLPEHLSVPPHITAHATTIRDLLIKRHLDARPEAVTGLPEWIGEDPHPLLNTSGQGPWWGRMGDGTHGFVTNGHSLLVVDGDFYAAPLADREGDVRWNDPAYCLDAVTKILRLRIGMKSHSVTARALCALPEEGGLTVAGVKLDLRLVSRWVGAAARCEQPTARIEVAAGGERDPVFFTGTGWRACIMPLLAFGPKWRRSTLRMRAA